MELKEAPFFEAVFWPSQQDIEWAFHRISYYITCFLNECASVRFAAIPDNGEGNAVLGEGHGDSDPRLGALLSVATSVISPTDPDVLAPNPYITCSEAYPPRHYTLVENPRAGDFGGKWKAGNATTFVNAPGYPTFNAQTGSPDFTVAKIDSLFKAGTPVTFQNNPGTGSKHFWIAKIRGGTSYVIVKFLTRIGNNNDCNCPNQGVTEFEYWKMPSGSTGIRPDMIVDRPAVHFKRSGGKK